MASFELLAIPVIDISALINQSEGQDETISLIGDACRHVGFFYISGHGVPSDLTDDLEALSHQFFALPIEQKKEIDMKLAGKAWRGYFGVGDEVTSGIPDQKEGIYFGTELSSEDPRYLHGPNLWPSFGGDSARSAHFRSIIETYLQHMKRIGTLLMVAVAKSMGQDLNSGAAAASASMFNQPTELFRVFNYPPHQERFGERALGVGEHTDYGYITILRQDRSGGLQVKRAELVDGEVVCSWLDAPPIDNTFVINLGDALERMTGGLYRATPHRVLQRVGATSNRISFPYFFDPCFDAAMTDFSASLSEQDSELAARNRLLVSSRWDKADPTQFSGTYGQYLMRKVSKVFPELAISTQVPTVVEADA